MTHHFHNDMISFHGGLCVKIYKNKLLRVSKLRIEQMLELKKTTEQENKAQGHIRSQSFNLKLIDRKG